MSKDAIVKLKSLLSWSDRIGSDEVYEIALIINLLENNSIDVEKTVKRWRNK